MRSHNAKSARRRSPEKNSTRELNAHCAHLLKRWFDSREESRIAVAHAQKVIRKSEKLFKEWSQVVTQARQRRRTSQHNKHPQIAVDRPDKPIVATARRVPWRRLQLEDLDGPYQLWVAPGQELT